MTMSKFYFLYNYTLLHEVPASIPSEMPPSFVNQPTFLYLKIGIFLETSALKFRATDPYYIYYLGHIGQCLQTMSHRRDSGHDGLLCFPGKDMDVGRCYVLKRM